MESDDFPKMKEGKILIEERGMLKHSSIVGVFTLLAAASLLLQGCGLIQMTKIEKRCNANTEALSNWYKVIESGQTTLSQVKNEKDHNGEEWENFFDLMEKVPRPNLPTFRQQVFTKCMSIYYPQDYGPKYAPRVGMTKTQVERSTWGKPSNFNIRSITTALGKTECWFYGDRVVFSICFGPNDKVVSISE